MINRDYSVEFKYINILINNNNNSLEKLSPNLSLSKHHTEQCVVEADRFCGVRRSHFSGEHHENLPKRQTIRKDRAQSLRPLGGSGTAEGKGR